MNSLIRDGQVPVSNFGNSHHMPSAVNSGHRLFAVQLPEASRSFSSMSLPSKEECRMVQLALPSAFGRFLVVEAHESVILSDSVFLRCRRQRKDSLCSEMHGNMGKTRASSCGSTPRLDLLPARRSPCTPAASVGAPLPAAPCRALPAAEMSTPLKELATSEVRHGGPGPKLEPGVRIRSMVKVWQGS